MTHTFPFRLIAKMMVVVLFSNGLAAQAKKPADPAAMKAKVLARGVGQGVRVTFADQTEAKGLIVAIGEHSFTLRPRKSTEVREIEYAQIVGVGNDHLTTGQKVGIAAGLLGVAVAITAIIIVHDLDKPWNL